MTPFDPIGAGNPEPGRTASSGAPLAGHDTATADGGKHTGNGKTPLSGSGNGHGPPPPGDPFAPPPPRPWYRRSTAIGFAAILVIAGVAVIADLPTPTTHADRVAVIATTISAIDTDVHPCTYAVTQAFRLYRQDSRGELTANQSAQVPGFLRDDQAACTFTAQSVVDLGTVPLPQTSAGQHLANVVKSVLVWETSDGAAAIDDIEALVAHPHDAAAGTDLSKREHLLAADRATIHRSMASVDRALGGAVIQPPNLPRLPTGS